MSAESVSIEAINEPDSAILPKIGYSIKEAEKITGLGRTTLWGAASEGKLKYFQVGRRVLSSIEHLQDFLKSYERSVKPSHKKATRISGGK